MRVARAVREVVVSAGAINSPKLLMLSGVGPGDHLAEMGVSSKGRRHEKHPIVVPTVALEGRYK